MGYNKKAVWRDISVLFCRKGTGMAKTRDSEEWDEPEGCGTGCAK